MAKVQKGVTFVEEDILGTQTLAATTSMNADNITPALETVFASILTDLINAFVSTEAFAYLVHY